MLFSPTANISSTKVVAHHKKIHHVTRHKHSNKSSLYTGFVIEGKVSTFGYLTGDSEGTTADEGEGGTARPCIAIRDDAKLDHWFEVTVWHLDSRGHKQYRLGHPARLFVCDYGPAAWTGRVTDVTGEGDRALGLSPDGFPTDEWVEDRELRCPKWPKSC